MKTNSRRKISHARSADLFIERIDPPVRRHFCGPIFTDSASCQNYQHIRSQSIEKQQGTSLGGLTFETSKGELITKICEYFLHWHSPPVSVFLSPTRNSSRTYQMRERHPNGAARWWQPRPGGRRVKSSPRKQKAKGNSGWTTANTCFFTKNRCIRWTGALSWRFSRHRHGQRDLGCSLGTPTRGLPNQQQLNRLPCLVPSLPHRCTTDLTAFPFHSPPLSLYIFRTAESRQPRPDTRRGHHHYFPHHHLLPPPPVLPWT